MDGEYPEAIYHIAVCPPQFHTTVSSVAFQLLTEWRGSSERWGRQCGGCSSLWMELIHPERTSNRPASISQVEHRWLSHARRPSAHSFQMHRACPLTRQTDWHTDQVRANWTINLHKHRRSSNTHTSAQSLGSSGTLASSTRLKGPKAGSQSAPMQGTHTLNLTCISSCLPLYDSHNPIARQESWYCVGFFFKFYLSTISAHAKCMLRLRLGKDCGYG